MNSEISKLHVTCSYSKSLKYFQTAVNGQISAILRKVLKSHEIEILSNYKNRILISDKFAFYNDE